MGRKQKEFVQSIQESHLSLGATFDLVLRQANPEELEVVTDPVLARAHRIYRKLGEKGFVPLVEVNKEAVTSTMHEAVQIAAEIAGDESGLN